MATDGVTCIKWLVASFLFPPFSPLASRLNPCLWGPLPHLTIGQFSSYPYRCLANPSALSPHFFQALKIFRPIASNFSIAARLSDAHTPQCRCPARRRRRTRVAALPRAQCVAQPSARAPRLDRAPQTITISNLFYRASHRRIYPRSGLDLLVASHTPYLRLHCRSPVVISSFFKFPALPGSTLLFSCLSYYIPPSSGPFYAPHYYM
ncbi:hypothetical protein B0H10DRAFT_4221 [Mycena sp. CBHHK59/15]|nr:hypothetical protein B0H10DRAFT_4221 [Mycena sp. CBHHK59/15]